MRTFIIAFFLFNLFISSIYLDTWKNSNTTSRALPVITWYESKTFRIDKYHELTLDKANVNGHYYTDKAPLPTYFVIPFFGILKSAGLIEANRDGDLFGDEIFLLGSFLTASLPFALMLLFVFLKIKRFNPAISPVLLSTLPFYASFIFVFVGTFFAHIFAAVFLLASYVSLKNKNFIIAGLLGGLSFLSEYNLAVILFLWGIWILLREQNFKPFLMFSIGILPSLFFIILYNSTFSSSPFTFLYKHHNFSELESNYGFILPGIEAFWGLTFSTYRGIFFYAPVLIFLFWYIFKLKPGEYKSQLYSFSLIPFALYFIFISSYFAWWGGWTYGPRLLLAMVVILIYETIIFIGNNKTNSSVFYLIITIGLFVALPAKFTIAYSAPTGILNPLFEIVFPDLSAGRINPNNMFTRVLEIDPVLSSVIFTFIFMSGFFLLARWFNILNEQIYSKNE